MYISPTYHPIGAGRRGESFHQHWLLFSGCSPHPCVPEVVLGRARPINISVVI